MIYRCLGLMSGSSLDGLDMAFVTFEEIGGKWNFDLTAHACKPYPASLQQKLKGATQSSALEYAFLNVELGKYIGRAVNNFIEENELQHQVQLIALHGHTTFHDPAQGLTAWLGNPADVAALTGINVVSDLRALDVALGGTGAPIVPMGEKLLFPDYDYFLNIGGIANISVIKADKKIAFDVCAANKVLNLLAEQVGKSYDEGGAMASEGSIYTPLLTELNRMEYYSQSYPKSLSNDFGITTIYPLVNAAPIPLQDKLRTYTEHIVGQVALALNHTLVRNANLQEKVFISGGGALNTFLVKRLSAVLKQYNMEVFVPEENILQYKEAIIMALLSVIRWREENTVMHEITGAKRASIGGAVWIGQEY